MVHMIIMPDGPEIVARESVGVQHPPERLRNEPPIRRLTLFTSGDTQRAKDRAPILGLEPALLGLPSGDAPVHMPMPACNTERNTVIEIVFRCALGSGVHRADQMELSLYILLI